MNARSRLLGALALLFLVLASAGVRVQTALDDPNFDARDAVGMMKSDPALLLYLTERVVAAGGGVPHDFRADPRIQFPGTTDVPAEFTVGEEFLVAWAQRLSGGRWPLHVTATLVTALLASLVGAGAYGLALARTRRVGPALFAAALVLLLPASYRSIGFVLVREDLSFPLFALHLAALAAALAREGRGRGWRFLVAGLLGGAALATWHALSFFVLLELGVLLGWAALRAPAAAPPRGALWAALGPVAAGLLVPAMVASGLLLGPAAWVGLALGVVLALARRPRGTRVAAGAAALLACWLAARLVGGGPSAYAHVHDVLVAKLLHLGRLPRDPQAMSFDARLLWQGPFDTLDPSEGPWLFGTALLALPGALVLLAGWRAGAERGADRALAALLLVALPAAWLVRRIVILPGLLAPVVLAVLGTRLGRPRGRALVAAFFLLVQLRLFGTFVAGHEIGWYQPPSREKEIAALVRWVQVHVPEDEAVAADFVDGPAILLDAGNPILLQPKYETDASRRRAEAFVTTLFHEPPEALERLLTERFRTRWLVVDRGVLLGDSSYLAGLPAGERPEPWSAVARLASTDPAVLAGVPGFQLVYRSSPEIRRPDGAPSDRFRVFHLVPPTPAAVPR